MAKQGTARRNGAVGPILSGASAVQLAQTPAKMARRLLAVTEVLMVEEINAGGSLSCS